MHPNLAIFYRRSGPGEKSNMLVLCLNYHADFDNSVIAIDSDTGTLVIHLRTYELN